MSTEKISDFAVGERLDKELARLYPKYSRALLSKIIDDGKVKVNGKNAKNKYKLKDDDVITIDFSSLSFEYPELDLPIVFEDDNVVVINKPTGVLAHSKGVFHDEPTVASWLKDKYYTPASSSDESAAKYEEYWGTNRAGIVHRLDRGTSGIMICAKHKEAQTFLQKQFAKRNVKKTYLAVIKGELSVPKGLIDIPIERNPKKPATFRAGTNGKPAQTYFETRYFNGTYSLVELRPTTGRTHQLRVHLNYLKHPIVGDDFYGGEKASRLLLHAWKLEITLPGSERTTFEAPIPSLIDKAD